MGFRSFNALAKLSTSSYSLKPIDTYTPLPIVDGQSAVDRKQGCMHDDCGEGRASAKCGRIQMETPFLEQVQRAGLLPPHAGIIDNLRIAQNFRIDT